MKRSTARVLTALVIGESVSSFEGAMIFSAMGALYRTFNDPILIGWIITAFVLVNAASTAIGARLGDLFGRRRVLLICLVLATVGSLISALSTEAWGVIIGRGVQGLAGPILPLCYGLVRENLAEERVPFGIGLISATAIFTSGIGFLLGGFIADTYSWQGVFFFSAGAALVAVPVVALNVPRSTPVESREPLDLIGGILFMVPLTALLFSIGKLKAWGWDDPRTLILVGTSLPLLAYWVWYESRQRSPLIDVRLLLQRDVALANIALVLIGFGAMQSAMVISLLMQQPLWTGVGMGLSATTVGFILFPSMIVSLIGGPWTGMLAARRGARLPLMLGAMLLTVTWTLIAFRHDNLLLLIALMVLHGLGQSIVFAAAPMLITAATPAGRTSEANGLSNVFRQTAIAVGAQVVSLVLALNSVKQTELGSVAYPSEVGFVTTFGLIIAASLLCVLAALAFRTRAPMPAPALTPARGSK